MLATPEWTLDLVYSLSVLAAVLVLAALYGVRVWLTGRASYERVNDQASTALLSKTLMEGAYWSLQPIARAAVFFGVTPNMISWSSFLLAIWAGACLAVGHFGFGGLFAALSSLLDAMDGMVARLTGKASDAGEVLDASIDRYAEFFILVGLVFHYRDMPMILGTTLAALMGSFMVSYSTAKAETLQVKLTSGAMRRPERALALALGAILSPLSISLWETGTPYSEAVAHPMVISVVVIAVLANYSATERLWQITRVLRARQAAATQNQNPNIVGSSSEVSVQRISLVTEIPGPQSRQLRKREERHLAPGVQGFATLAGITVRDARGSYLNDVDGNTFLDIIGGIGVNGLGHSHPQIVEAIRTQVEKVSVGSFTSEARVELLERLAAHRPSASVHRTQLYSSGAEAVESALRLAKCRTGRSEFVSFWGGFHGKTQGALSLMGSDFKNGLGPMVPGSHLVPYANCYRCPLRLTYPSCGLACVELLRKQLRMTTTGGIAAFIVEPMQGTAGNVIPPPEFLPAVKSVAREMDALLIVDEMITGFGRTGKYWGAWHSGVEADIVTLGKQFGGGYPVSALMSSNEVVESKPWSNPSGSSSSYGGNPLAAAAAAAALKVIDEENLVENSRRMGEYFLARLQPFLERYSFVGEVRGAGLFLAMELVTDKRSREPLSKEMTQWIFSECLKRGLLTMSYSASFRIQPPMTIDRATIDQSIEVLSEVFQQVEVRLSGRLV